MDLESGNSLLLPETRESFVSLSLLTDESAESKGGVLTGVSTSGVDVANVDLNRAVVLGLNETVGGRALARDVKIHLLAGEVFHID